jgi:hypothetical protein
VDDFLKEVKKEHSPDLDNISSSHLLRSGLFMAELPSHIAYFGNDDENPLFFTITRIPVKIKLYKEFIKHMLMQ